MGGDTRSSLNLVGTWRLLSFADHTSTTYPLGERVIGRITYEPSGHMAVQMTGVDRPRLSSSDLAALGPDEYRDAFLSYLAYFGRYTVQEGAVVHHVEGASNANWVGTDQVRYVELAGNRLTLRSQPVRLADGREVVLVAVWEKMANGNRDS
jgi:lipocalin-like protein